VYSLVNIATLVRNLARHPRAEQVATELLRALALGPADFDQLDRIRYEEETQGRRRASVLAADAARPRALEALAAARDFADDLGIDAYAAAVDVLEQAPLGDLDALARFVRHDVLAECWAITDDVAVARWPRALDVVTDGVLGAHAGDDELAGPWLAWADDHGIAPDATAWPHVVRAVSRLRPGARVAPAPAEWAARMHEACWAVHLTGRERAAAVTQLHALRAISRAWAPEPPPLRVVAMTTAAVHAAVVADVLDGATGAAMSQPLFSVSSGAMPPR
jgi:hypothetical protein